MPYNSGIDKVLCVPKVIPVISKEDQEDESSDNVNDIDDGNEDYV